VSVDPPPSKDDKFLGHSAFDLFSAPDRWLGLLTDKASRLVLEEAVQFGARGFSSEKLLTLQDHENKPSALSVKIHEGTAAHLAALEIRPAGLNEIAEKLYVEEASKELDVMIVDSAFVPEDPAGWMEGLRMRAVQMGLVKEAKALKFMITAEPEASSASCSRNFCRTRTPFTSTRTSAGRSRICPFTWPKRRRSKRSANLARL
jgi:hypothetical protein